MKYISLAAVSGLLFTSATSSLAIDSDPMIDLNIASIGEGEESNGDSNGGD